MSKQWLGMLVVGLLSTLTAGPGHAIEMFTFFGDGSRIGLPSLEVPIEAYPGIPLRSDRIRARRRGMRSVPAPGAQQGMPPGVTIRAMPTEREAPLPPTVRQSPARRSTTAPGRGTTAAGASTVRQSPSGLPVPPLPPEPEDLLEPRQPAGSERPRTVAQPTTQSINVQPPLADPR